MNLVHLYKPHGGPIRTYDDELLFVTIGVDDKEYESERHLDLVNHYFAEDPLAKDDPSFVSLIKKQMPDLKEILLQNISKKLDKLIELMRALIRTRGNKLKKE